MDGVIEDLELTVSAETRTRCLEIAREHEAELDAIGPTERRPVETPGSLPGDDPYNAIIHKYTSIRSESDVGPLDNLRVVVKDNIAVAGLPLTCGSEDFDCDPSFDAVVVERLLGAGADIVGKANMEPFALGPTGEFSDFGVVENPRYEDRIPGGSSSGSAAAVASDIADAALGSDTGGSVRIPAACCGLVGMKPTHRLVPRYGFVDLGPSFDCIGPITEDVETATSILEAIVGPDPRDPSAAHKELATPPPDLEGLIVGVPESLVAPSSAEVRAVFTDFISDLRSDEHLTLTDICLDLGQIEDAFFHLNVNEFAWLLRQTGAIHGQGTGYSEEIRQAFESMRVAGLENEQIANRVLPSAFLDRKTNSRSYTAAQTEVRAFTQRLSASFEKVDALLAPTLRTVPPRYDRGRDKAKAIRELASNTMPFNMSGSPVVTLPIGDSRGLPVSAQVITPKFTDLRALSIARYLEGFTQ